MARKRRKNTLTYIEETPKHHAELVRVARRGVKQSIDAAREAGLFITYAKDSKIVREHPDGRLEVIGSINERPIKVVQGSRVELS